MTRLAAAVLTALCLSACGGPPPGYQVAAGTESGGGTAGLVTWYGTQNLAWLVDAFADGMAGKSGQIEIRGPLHLLCTETFAGPRPIDGGPTDVFLSGSEKEERTLRRLPVLDFPAMRFPRGRYVASLARPKPAAPIAVQLDVSHDESLDAFTGIYFNPGCMAIADSAAQRRDLVSRDLTALARLIGQLPTGDFRTSASAYTDSASSNFARGNLSAPAVDVNALTALASAQPPMHTPQVVEALGRECASLLGQSFVGG